MPVLSVKANKSYAKNIFRKVVPIAATIAVVFMSMIVAQAAGVDIFGSLARWTEETFRFNGGDSAPAANGARPQVEDETYLAIQAEVDKLDIDIPVVPTWFPGGYELEELTPPHPDITDWKDVGCLLRNEDDKTIVFSVTKYREGYDISSHVFEKDDRPVTEYLGGGKLFYIMTNNSHRTATWSDGQIMVIIGGDLSEETIKTMIDSIGGAPASSQAADERYLAIQAEVDKLDIDVPVVPTWFPDGYELQDIQLPDPDITEWKDINCYFNNKDNESFFLSITKYKEDFDISSIVFEKDGQPVTEYLKNKKLFYIMTDKEYRTAAWSDNHVVISLSGPLSEETIKTIIDSIGG